MFIPLCFRLSYDLSDDDYPFDDVDSTGNVIEDVDDFVDDGGGWSDHYNRCIDQRQPCGEMRAHALDIDDWYTLKCQSANYGR
jgi:regulatory protein YycH of two-component signal transduction system YycFG